MQGETNQPDFEVDQQTLLISILVRAGANESKQQMNTFSALLWALDRGDAHTVRALVQAGANIPTSDRFTQEKILQAANNGFGYSGMAMSR